MALFKKRCKKCTYCGKNINKGKEVWERVKVPEFKNEVRKPFCSSEHAELYKKCIKGTPRKNFCPRCGV
jgi:hypothetical protein